MKLSDIDIDKAINDGQINITPRPRLGQELTGCTIDLRIGDRFRKFKPTLKCPYEITLNKDKSSIIEQVNAALDEEILIPQEQYFVLKSGELVLAHTAEIIEIGDRHVGVIEGKSTIGRLGVHVHVTSNRIDPGFKGQITLEVFNSGPTNVRIQPGCIFSSLTIEPLTSQCLYPYNKKNSKYQNQTGASKPT